MKKITKIALIMMTVILLLLAIILPLTIKSKVDAIIAPSKSTQQIQDDFIFRSISSGSWQPAFAISPMNGPIVGGDTGDVVTAPVYLEDGSRVGFIRETRMLVTEDGRPVMNPTDGTVALYDEEKSLFTDSADRTLSIYLDSFLSRHYLLAGGKYLTAINMDREVVLVTLNTESSPMLIYAFREKIKRGFWATINPLNWGIPAGHRYFDMNGRVIDTKYLISNDKTSAGAVIGQLFNPLWWYNLPAGNFIYPVVEILECTTLRDLYTVMESSTIHPWDTLRCLETDLPVVSQDGRVVYINPRTNQLVDFFGWALFNVSNGLPIIYYEGDIITTNKVSQTVTNAVLVNTMTVWQLLDSGTEFYMGIIPTSFGSFDVPMFNWSTDKNNPDYRLMNGDSAKGITIEHMPSTVLNGESLTEWFNRTFKGLGSVFGSLLSVFLIILAVPLLFLIIKMFMFLFALIPNNSNNNNSRPNRANRSRKRKINYNRGRY